MFDLTAPLRRPDIEAGFRFMFDSGPIGQVFCAVDGTVAAANPALAAMLGYPVADLIGRPAVEFVAESDRPALARDTAALREAARAGRPSPSVDSVHRYRHRDGHEVPVRVISTLFCDPDGTPRWWLSVVIDQTDRERAHADLELAHAAALESSGRLRLLHTVSAAANDARTLDELVPHVLRSVCAHFGWPGGARVRWRTGTEPSAWCTHSYGTESISPTAARLALGPVGEAPGPDDEPVVVTEGHQRLVVLALAGAPAGDDRHALVFVPAGDAPDGRAREVLALVAAECSRVAEREDTARMLRATEARFRTVFDASPFPMALTLGESGTFYAVNEALCRLVGRPRHEIVGASIRELTHPDDVGFTDLAGATAMIAPGAVHRVELRLVHTSGAVIAVVITLSWLDGPEGARLLLAQMEDITGRRAATSARSAEMSGADLDDLTGLANRTGLARALEQVRSSGRTCAVLFLDLDGFKLVNDIRGPGVGDEVLAHAAARLRQAADPGDVVARIGGDAFVLVHPYADADPEPVGDARRRAERVRAAFAVPIHVGRAQLRITASVGLSVSAAGARSSVELLQHAEAAMYQAKRLGKDRVVLYDAALHDETVRGQRSALALRNALHENRLVVHYQPVVRLSDASIVGSEALVRLRDETGRLVPPNAFIPAAEQSGLIVPMGEWVLREACRTAVRLRRLTGRPLGVSVNVAAQQAARSDLGSTVVDALGSAGLPPEALVLELTESALLEAQDSTLDQLVALRARGVRIALDDFGTGYSSLTYLRRLPVTHIKVDRSFVSGLTSDDGDAAIVRAVVGLAADLGLRWVAEGVETREQWQALARLGPGYAQGYLFSRPVPADALADRLTAADRQPVGTAR